MKVKKISERFEKGNVHIIEFDYKGSTFEVENHYLSENAGWRINSDDYIIPFESICEAKKFYEDLKILLDKEDAKVFP
jgi:hypothetical protein